MMEPWHKRLPVRWRTELCAGENLSLRLEWLPFDLVSWRGAVEVEGVLHTLQIIYPPDFPARPPWVRETESLTDTTVDDADTYHQLLDGSLCLFALGTGPDAWSPELTVRDVIARYREFRTIANARGHIDEHGLPLPDVPELPTVKIFSMTLGQREVLRVTGTWGWLYAYLMGHGKALIVARIETADGRISADQDLSMWETAALSRRGVKLPWLSTPHVQWRELVLDRDAFDQVLKEKLPATHIQESMFALLVDNEPEAPRVLLLERSPHHRLLHPHQVFFDDLSTQLFQRVDGAMSGRESLAQWRVVMVGLGSLGSDIAVKLAQAGVSRFALFDPDRVRPENVCRHAIGIGGLYLRKPDAVRARILDCSPIAAVKAFASSPLWDGAPAASQTFETLLSEPNTIVVVTTADDAVERAINTLAHLHRCPVVYASVIGAGEQGRIYRVLPDQTPCYACIPRQQQRHPGRFFRGEEIPEPRPPAIAGYRQSGIPGIGIDVGIIAGLTARFVLQTISRCEDAIDYPDAPGHHMVWTNRAHEEFDLSLQARWEPYERDPGCPVCLDSPEDADESLRAQLRALEAKLSVPERLTTTAIPLLRGSSG